MTHGDASDPLNTTSDEQGSQHIAEKEHEVGDMRQIFRFEAGSKPVDITLGSFTGLVILS